MSLSLEINGTERITNLKPRSLRITKRGEGNNNCGFVLNTQAGTFKPNVGEEVIIEYDGTQVYGGLIKAANITKITPAIGNTADIEINISCDGYNEIPSRRTIAAEYTGQTAGYIVEALRALTIDAEGVGAGTISDGITVKYFLQICVSLKQVYDELADSCGFKWYIDESKDLYFVAEDAIVDADEDIVEGGSFTDYSNLQLSESFENYANKVFVKGGWGTDGALLYLNVEDATEIAARAAIEGGTGVYGHIIEDTNITTSADATALAELYLQKHAFAPAVLTFNSYKVDWIVGTRLKVNLPALGISSDTYFLIEEVSIVREDTGILRSFLKCTKRRSGADFSTQKDQTGTEYFVKLVREAKKKGGISSLTETLLTNAVKSYRSSITASATITTSLTTVCQQAITLEYNADIHVSFSAYVDTDTANITAYTYLTQGNNTSETVLMLTAHGLETNDAVVNTTVSSSLTLVTYVSDDELSHEAITGQASLDVINKYHVGTAYTTLTGTTTANITIDGHGLTTSDYITNTTQSATRSVTAVVDTANFTVSNISGQTTGDTIIPYIFTAAQTAEDTAAARDYQPSIDFDAGKRLFTYVDTIKGVPADDILIETRMQADVNSFSINAEQAVLSILTIPALSVVITDEEPEEPVVLGALWGVGEDNYGQLGQGSTANYRANLTQIGTSTWKAMAINWQSTLGILDDNTLWACGRDDYGQLGQGSTATARTTLVQIGTSTWKKIAIGALYSLAIRGDDTLWGCGLNWKGELGQGSTNLENVNLLQIGTSTWKAISTKESTSLGIRSDDTLWGCGNDTYGQLGQGSTATARTTLVQIGTSTWKAVSCGIAHTVAIRSDDTLWGCGSDNVGQLGQGSTATARTTLVQIGASTWKAVSCGAIHTIAIRSDDTLWGCGYDAFGQLGQGATTSVRHTLVQIGTSTWKAVSCGDYHTIAIRSDDTLWACGRDNFYQLGQGSTAAARSTLVQVGASTWKGSAAGIQNTIGLL